MKVDAEQEQRPEQDGEQRRCDALAVLDVVEVVVGSSHRNSDYDLRCNIEQAEHLFTILRLLGREVEFVRFPAESHELTRSGSPFHRVTRLEIVVDWFDRYLK